MMKLFVAYPFRFEGYREAFATAFAGSGIELLYGDDIIADGHLLEKLREMLSACDLALFDVSGANANVLLELGIAIGARHPYIVAKNDSETPLSSNIQGWDHLRYDTFAGLAKAVRDRVERRAVPRRAQAQISIPRPAALQFGFYTVSTEPEVGISMLPIDMQPLQRETLRGDAIRRAVIDGVISASNRAAQASFLGSGFNWSDGEDHYTVFSGETLEERNAVRVWLDGRISLTKKLPLRGGEPATSLRAYAGLVRMSLTAFDEIQKRLGFTATNAYVFSAFRNAAALRVSGISGFLGPLDPSPLAEPADAFAIPSAPELVQLAELSAGATAIAVEWERILRSKLPFNFKQMLDES